MREIIDTDPINEPLPEPTGSRLSSVRFTVHPDPYSYFHSAGPADRQHRVSLDASAAHNPAQPDTGQQHDDEHRSHTESQIAA